MTRRAVRRGRRWRGSPVARGWAPGHKAAASLRARKCQIFAKIEWMASEHYWIVPTSDLHSVFRWIISGGVG
jgi:hypothetical protein